MDPNQLSPGALAILRAAMQRYRPGEAGAAGQGFPPQGSPQLQWNRAGANAANGMGFNDVQRATGLNLDPRVGISGLWNPQIPPERRIQEDFRQFPGYY